MAHSVTLVLVCSQCTRPLARTRDSKTNEVLCLPTGMWTAQIPGRNLVTITRQWCNRLRGISCGRYGKMALGADKFLCVLVCVTRSSSSCSLPVSALCSRMRQNPERKSLHKSFRRTSVRHCGVITFSCNLSSLGCFGHLAWTKNPYSCSWDITWYNLGKMGNISNKDPGRGRG